MAVYEQYLSDVETILSKRYDNGWDYWTTPDKRLLKGSPFNSIESALMLLELGMEPDESPLKEVTDLIFAAWREDGQFKLYPKGAVYPCQTAAAASALCHFGYADDERLRKTFRHLLDTQHFDGGWQCKKYFFGRGPETEFSNPWPTLAALNAFRFTDYLNREAALDRAVEFLLSHWVSRLPLGPCHYGIGSRFMQVEYPLRDYNLFHYVYVLSFYDSAKKDPRFLDALGVLQSKLVDGNLVPERVNKKLEELSFCKKGEPSELGTRRYLELLDNLN